jgi:hypothetical protein
VSQAQSPQADWYPDPSGRFQFRYWDGEAWSGHVATDGRTEWDTPGAPNPGGMSAEESIEQEHVTSEPEAAEPVTTAAVTTDDEPLDQDVGSDQVDASAETSGTGDVNRDANTRADLPSEVRTWLDEVAAQVKPRLNRIAEDWSKQPQSDAAPACAYGLLLGHMARLHPHMRADLSRVAEAHASFSTLESGHRLEILDEIAGDQRRAAAWLGPLIGTDDSERVSLLFD